MFWRTLDTAVRDVPRGDRLVMMMDVNARNGVNEAASNPKVLGAYGHDTERKREKTIRACSR